MKAIKIFGLAALMALMAMAFVGASSATAEPAQLCGHDPEAGLACEAIHHVHEESVGKAKLLTNLGTTECNFLFLGDLLPGTTALIHGTFTYTNCTFAGSKCTATEENGPAEIKVLRTGHETSEVTGEYLIHLVCGSSIDCSYNGVGLKGIGKGPLLSAQTPDNGEVTISEATMNKETGGFLCPKTTKLDLTTTPLWPIYILSGLLGYCVRTEHTVGIYTDETCKTVGKEGTHIYEYTLVFGPEGQEKGKLFCYGTLLKFGLYEAKKSLNDCEKDIVSKEPNGLYERGEIKTVE